MHEFGFISGLYTNTPEPAVEWATRAGRYGRMHDEADFRLKLDSLSVVPATVTVILCSAVFFIN